MAVFASLISRGHFALSGDAVHYMVIAQSLALDGDLDLANDYTDSSRLLNAEPESHARRDRAGVLRPVHSLGLPLVSVPFFRIAYALADRSNRLPAWVIEAARLNKFIALRQLISLFMIGVTVLLTVQLFRLLATWTAPIPSAIATFVLIASPPIVSLGYVFMTEIPAAAICVLLFRRAVAGMTAATRGHALALGVATGFLVLLHVRNAGAAAALAAIFIWQLRSSRRLAAAYGIGLLATCSIHVAFNYFFWGQAVTGPHARIGRIAGASAIAVEMTTRTVGMLVDQRHGLLLTAPIFLLVPAGLLALRSVDRRTVSWSILVAGAYLTLILVPMTNDHGWRGGWSPPARFWVPVVLLLAIGLPQLLETGRGRLIAGVLVAAQLAIDVVCWTRPMTMWTETAGESPVLSALVGALAARLPVVDRLTPTSIAVASAAMVVAALIAAADLRERRTLAQRR
jgi:hypothetical protein